MINAGQESLDEAFKRVCELDLSLGEQLGTFADEVRRRAPDFAAAVDRLVERLQRYGAGESAPQIGEPMPAFVLPDDAGHLVSLDALLSHGPVAVTFHRGHWCPYCRINTKAFAEAREHIEAGTAQFAAIVPERQEFAARVSAEGKGRFPVLTDVDNGYALSLNLAIWVGDEMQKILESGGRQLPNYQGNKAWVLPIPATFVIDKDGIITARFIDPDHRKRMAIEDLVSALRDAH